MSKRNADIDAAINAIKATRSQVDHCIRMAQFAFGNDKEFSVLLGRLQEGSTVMHEAENQAFRMLMRIVSEEKAA